ncbi:MAG: ROK family transcriptional regulator [Albidovulum sp.]|nr:ROK family transcriptional regulator [Albidovulum sp.]MDE0532027.1 ROK family transcriptional regulator [Albidovulum sp.]
MSKSAVAQTVLHNGPISRSAIARHTGLSQPTIGEIVREFEGRGWIREAGRTSGHIGRSAATYEIIPNSACLFAADIGGTRARAVVVNIVGQFLAEIDEKTDKRGGNHVIEQMARMCGKAKEIAGIASGSMRLAVIGVPGVPDEDTGGVSLSPNIPGIDMIDLKSAMSEKIGTGVILENDVNLAVQGEHWTGKGKGIGELVFINLGTGVGSGIMIGGKLVRGNDSAAGELAYLPMGADPFEIESLRAGAFERRVGTCGIRQRFLALSGRDLEVPEIFDRALAGDANAKTVIDETALYLTRAVAAVSAVVAPKMVILGGSIGLRRELAEKVRSLFPKCFPNPVAIERSALGARAALAGGAAVGLTHLHATLFSGRLPASEVLPPACIEVSLLGSEEK